MTNHIAVLIEAHLRKNYMYLGWVNTYSQVSQFGQFGKHTAR